jgi:serine protease inhibitor ecotin
MAAAIACRRHHIVHGSTHLGGDSEHQTLAGWSFDSISRFKSEKGAVNEDKSHQHWINSHTTFPVTDIVTDLELGVLVGRKV